MGWLFRLLGIEEKTPRNLGVSPPMSSFDRAMEFVLRWEGGYVNHPNDPGGETNFGIAKRSHPGVDIKNLTEESAKEIYKIEYWDRIRGDELPDVVAVAVMDYAVNSGVSRASRALQRAVYAGVDGQIGPKTIAKVQEAVADVGNRKIAQKVVLGRSDFLSNLVVNKPDMAVFLKGWLRRTHSLMIEVMS